MGQLTTHVLDTANGHPADAVRIELYLYREDKKHHIKSVETNADGRCDVPLLAAEEMQIAQYELVFSAGDYFSRQQDLPEPRFIDTVVIRFGIADINAHYHVPLLVSPYSYSTYRGS